MAFVDRFIQFIWTVAFHYCDMVGEHSINLSILTNGYNGLYLGSHSFPASAINFISVVLSKMHNTRQYYDLKRG